MTDKTVDGFFYGLFMDPDVLAQYEIPVRDPRQAYVDSYELVIGDRATLWPSDDARSFGMIYSMTHQELEKLYSGTGLTLYKPEALLTRTLDNAVSGACLCFNLPERPGKEERNHEYSKKLIVALSQLGFPGEYIEELKKSVY